MPERPKWPTTTEVAAAAGAHETTVGRWVKQGLLPTPTIINMGRRRGRTTRWPLHAPEQAAWVRARLDEGWTFPEVLEALARGEFKPSIPIESAEVDAPEE